MTYLENNSTELSALPPETPEAVFVDDGQHSPIAALAEEETFSDNRESIWNKLRRHQLKIALGGVAVSTSLTIATNFEHAKHQIVEAAPWMASALGASEIAWIGGGAMMLAGVGSKIGNPLKIRSRMPEIAAKANDSRLFKAGFAVNASAAVGQAGILTAGIVGELPPESWGFLGLPAADLSSTLLLRKAIWDGMKKNAAEESVLSAEAPKRIGVRAASQNDLERIADIDLSRYKKVYGQNPPVKEEVVEMFRKRLENATSDWMYVCELNNQVEGFITGFRTNKGMDDFVSWEDSTADGTLEDRVDSKGKYVYIANLTLNPIAMENGGEIMLMGRLMAEGIKNGIEYGYFVSRVPIFSAWVKRQARQKNIDTKDFTAAQLNELAAEYVGLKESVNGKEVASDPELRMYDEVGFERGRLIENAFEDPQSLNYGVLYKVPVPPMHESLKRMKPVRHSMSLLLKGMIATRRPQLLEKII